MTPPAHHITLEPSTERVRVELDGIVLADTRSALLLREGKLPVRRYLPRDDVALDRLTPTDHASTCPFKGAASYWSFGEHANVAWSYESPIDGMEQIAGRIAFYDDRVESIAGG